MKDRVISIIRELLGIKYMLSAYQNEGVMLSTPKKIFCYMRGFCLGRYELYHLERKGAYKQFIKDTKRIKMGAINKPYHIVLNDKWLFYKLLENTGNVPNVYGYIQNKHFYKDGEKSSFDELVNVIKEKKNIIVKLDNEGGGIGVYHLFFDGKALLVNEEKTQLKTFLRTLNEKSKYIVMEYIYNGEYSKNIYNKCTNTIRLHSVRMPDDNSVYTFSAYHRFGADGSKATDNYQQGGLYSAIDIHTGIISEGYIKSKDGKGMTKVYVHPDTGNDIIGVQIPRWSEVLETVEKLMNQLGGVRYVGWDVVVTDEKIIVLEGNNNSGMGGQFNHPYLADPKLRKFFKYYNVIS